MAAIAAWLVIWILVAHFVDKELLLPYPWTVLKTLGKLCLAFTFWKAVAYSLLRILIGIVIGLVCGTLVAVLTSKSEIAYKFLYPMITVIRATPVASFIILAWLLLGAGTLPAFITFLMVFPIAWSAVSDGIKALDPNLADACKSYRFSFGKRLRVFYIPSILPYFLSACKTAIGMGWKAGVAAEVLAVTPISIGMHLYNAKLYLETPDLFAWTTVTILLSLLFERLASALIDRSQKRRRNVKN